MSVIRPTTTTTIPSFFPITRNIPIDVFLRCLNFSMYRGRYAVRALYHRKIILSISQHEFLGAEVFDREDSELATEPYREERVKYYLILERSVESRLLYPPSILHGETVDRVSWYFPGDVGTHASSTLLSHMVLDHIPPKNKAPSHIQLLRAAVEYSKQNPIYNVFNNQCYLFAETVYENVANHNPPLVRFNSDKIWKMGRFFIFFRPNRRPRDLRGANEGQTGSNGDRKGKGRATEELDEAQARVMVEGASEA